MSLTINAKTYVADGSTGSASSYQGPLKTVSVKDDVRLSRTAPKTTSLFSGVGRTEYKLTRTMTLTGALTPSHDAIISIQVSVPVGAASADIDSLLNDSGAFLASASYKDLVKKQLLTF